MTRVAEAVRASIWGRALEPKELLRGKAATLTGVPTGGWFGEGSLLKSEPRRYDAVALRDCRIALTPRATFTRLLDSSIAFNRFLLEQLNERLAQFIAMLEYEIGNLSGISRQRVNQALQALERDGLLRVEYGAVTIFDLEGLRQR